jgi:hypothetical protein
LSVREPEHRKIALSWVGPGPKRQSGESGITQLKEI